VFELHALSAHFVLPEGQPAWHELLVQTCPDWQGAQLVPQWVALEGTQEPEQETKPREQAHEPFWQLVPVPQTVPQLPQFSLSVCTLTQAPPQDSWPDEHVGPVDGVPFAQLESRISAERKAVASDGKGGLRSFMIDSFRGNFPG